MELCTIFVSISKEIEKKKKKKKREEKQLQVW